MAHAKEGWTHAVMGTTAAGEIVIVLEFPRQWMAERFLHGLALYYQHHVRRLNHLCIEYMPESRAKYYRHLLADSSTPSARSKAGGAKAPWSLATAAKVLARINAAWRRGLMRVEKMLTGRDLPSTGRQQKE